MDRKFKQRIEGEKKEKSVNEKTKQYYTNTEFILLLVGGFFLILLLFWRPLLRMSAKTVFPINILLFIALIVIGLLFFLFFIGTKKY